MAAGAGSEASDGAVMLCAGPPPPPPVRVSWEGLPSDDSELPTKGTLAAVLSSDTDGPVTVSVEVELLAGGKVLRWVDSLPEELEAGAVTKLEVPLSSPDLDITALPGPGQLRIMLRVERGGGRPRLVPGPEVYLVPGPKGQVRVMRGAAFRATVAAAEALGPAAAGMAPDPRRMAVFYVGDGLPAAELAQALADDPEGAPLGQKEAG
ncbi:MAG: hypothetical protein D6705_10390 [Deltaproteobacteria bacterium]|nr:MAG: hypothetical protein D6705_10390 [Deltaproteobacteria bacterium]